MLQEPVIIMVGLFYLATLFGIAWWADRRAEQGHSLLRSPWIYTLSIAVYCTAWTFYGSVGLAAESGLAYLPIYLGPTIMGVLAWVVLSKIIHIAHTQHLTSIADFIAARYGKSLTIGRLVTFIALVGILPYIAIQLKAMTISFDILSHYPDMPTVVEADRSIFEDKTFYLSLLLGVFVIAFGTRHIDATERHEGMVAAIAFESLVKLFAFLAVGIFVCYSLYDSPADLFSQASHNPELNALLSLEALPDGWSGWFTLLFLSMCAIICLPRQFQITVVENTDLNHLRHYAWGFPLYLFLINLFVLPITLGGRMQFADGAVVPDTYVLTLPIEAQADGLALLVFIGGLAAATGMVIVGTISLATMISNDFILPFLLKRADNPLEDQRDLSRTLLHIRRASILLILLLGYGYYYLIGESYALAKIGTLSFAAAAQFAPALFIGLYWRNANHTGALLGMSAGFLVWCYTLLLPALIGSGWLADDILRNGPWGIEALRPTALFGLGDWDTLTHGVFWSMLLNIGGLLVGSILTRAGTLENVQAALFTDMSLTERSRSFWRSRSEVSNGDLLQLLGRFLGAEKARKNIYAFCLEHQLNPDKDEQAHQSLIAFVEQQLGGAIGSASARTLISSIASGEVLSLDGVMAILDETSQVRAYSRRLEKTSEELRTANERLMELDKLKDEFLSSVTHELRTPLTSIRAFSEILRDNQEMTERQREEFLSIIVKESERLTRLINDVLDLAKIEAKQLDWHIDQHDIGELVEDAVASLAQWLRDEKIELELSLPEYPLEADVDPDRIIQVIINLLSNAVKFCPKPGGHISVSIVDSGEDRLEIYVDDNGPGIPIEKRDAIFNRFTQLGDSQAHRPQGSGLGLPISQKIIEYHDGHIRADESPCGGTRMFFSLPLSSGHLLDG